MPTLIWFRQDLRISDHAALWHASQHSACLALVILSPQQWQQHDDAPIKLDFYLRQLRELQQQLQQLPTASPTAILDRLVKTDSGSSWVPEELTIPTVNREASPDDATAVRFVAVVPTTNCCPLPK